MRTGRHTKFTLLHGVAMIVVAVVVSYTLVALYDRLTGEQARFGISASPEELARAQRDLDRAQRALESQDFAAAEQAARRVLQIDPQSVAALLVAGEAATWLQRPGDALGYYSAVPDDGTEQGIEALGAAGSLWIYVGRPAEAEKRFRQVLAYDPQHVLANRNLAFLLYAQGRNWEAEEYLFRLVQQREATLEELALLTDITQTVDQAEYLEFCRTSVPDNVTPKIGLARLAWANAEPEKALSLIRKVIADASHPTDAQIVLGHLLQHREDYDELFRWHQQLSMAVNDHPEVWFLRGTLAQAMGEPRGAIRCYWEAIRRNPNQASANYRLSQLLVALEEPGYAEPFLKRSRDLEELATIVERFVPNNPNRQRMIRMGQLNESLGRLWEAWAWYDAVAATHGPAETPTGEHQRRLAAILRKNPPRTLESANPALQVDLSSFPLPQWKSPEGDRASQALAAQQSDGPQFIDMAATANLDFEYFNSNDSQRPGMELYQQMGGGIAVLDFDGDGWPDIYLSQGAPWPPESGQTRYVDRLYRNLGNGTFQEVTAPANLGNDRYSQGVTVGDFNNDGFPDLYVANIGGNRLYRNEGDGTFTEITLEAGITGQEWTTSCLMADLNGNGMPDIYDVNYLVGKALETICWDGDEPRACSPANFDGEQDRLFMNLGDGRFEEVTDRSGIVLPDGKGLGIVAADFEGTGQLSLFVANDGTANFFFVNQDAGPNAPPSFIDEALLAGLAFDENGRSQACMGIAIDDASGNGRFEMLVTNFYNESNAFYRQQSGRMFIDDPGRSGIRDPSLRKLGFGTQFLDADLNGRPDLVVTNGHIDDFRHRGEPYEMRPQFFQNVGQGRLEELPRQRLGDYFQKELLGRSLARVDWDRDGKDDFVVMHLDAPVGLLTNRTDSTGNFLALHLRGVDSSRDAIGTSVYLTAGGKTYFRQLTAGDGFHASNQRRLTFGLAQAELVEELRVRWPSGREQEFKNLPVNQEWILVEGHGTPVPMPSPH